jgi:hypothetical protein
MADLTYITYCGLYCKHCSVMIRIPRRAKALYEAMKLEGFEFFGPGQSPEFNDFWKHLQYLKDYEENCPGCRGGCCYPQCEIRKCAREKGVEICVYCDEYPCERFNDYLLPRYPALLADGQKLKEMGIDAWIAMQEKRYERGYCLSDGRYEIEFP